MKNEFQNGQQNGLLLGDGGYPCKPYLLTPLLHATTPPEIRYNRAHCSTRASVERTFGQWKAVFRSLQNGLHISLQTTKAAIVAMAILFNIKKIRDGDDCTWLVSMGERAL